MQTDTLTCPTCHHETEPEYRTERVREGVLVRVRCAGCGRLWKGLLQVVDESRITA